MKYTLSIFFSVLVILSSCIKKRTCAGSMTLTVTTLTPTEGDDIVITGLKEGVNDVFQWNGPKLNLSNQTNILRIDDIKLSQSGTYYCNKGNMDCHSSLSDSIVINVQLKQETPPCTPANNTVTSSSLPTTTFTSVTKSFTGTFGAITMYANGTFGYPPFTIVFNSYSGNVEPKDGVYYTSQGYTFSMLDEPNLISVSFIYGSEFYHCHPGKKVYVSHVNGKLQVTFCNLDFAPAAIVSGKITQL